MTESMADAVLARLEGEPVGAQQVATVLRALSPHVSSGARAVLSQLAEEMEAQARATKPRAALSADYVAGWNARSAVAANSTDGLRFAMRGADKKVYYPKIAADITEGSVIVCSRVASDWKTYHAQDIALLNLREDPMFGGRYEASEYTYESWMVGHTWEYRVSGTSALVKDVISSGYAEHQALCGGCDWRTWPVQVPVETLLDDAWAHWKKEHDGVLS